MICPVCYNKIKKNRVTCSVCKFSKNELKTASNKAVSTSRKNGYYDDVIYTSEFPKDLSYKKTLTRAILGGWFGLHNLYVKRKFKGYFSLLTLIIGFVTSSLVLMGVLFQEYMPLVVYSTMLYVIALALWVIDLINLALKTYKVPVVLKKNINKGENK
jgi:hypothetical protein